MVEELHDGIEARHSAETEIEMLKFKILNKILREL